MTNSRKSLKKLVYTLPEKCKVCYTCVRECPAKAIRIFNGQAEVIHERCIGCGNCIKVCSQDAKVFVNTTSELEQAFQSGKKVIAMVAPSFPAEFQEIDNYKVLVGMIKKMGFDHVHEVAFGADLVAQEYKKLLESNAQKGYISSDCPAIVYYIAQYYPDLISRLVPVVSPMVAMARVIRSIYQDQDIIICFIGPCLAKKAESAEIDVAITFRELRDLFEKYNINTEQVKSVDFDEPHAWKGAIFPISRGLIQSMGCYEDLIEARLIVADGRLGFQEAIKEYATGTIENQHLELLCCEGCIMGPGMSMGGKKYDRRKKVSTFVNNKMKEVDQEVYTNNLEKYKHVNLVTSFTEIDRRIPRPDKSDIDKVLKEMGKTNDSNRLNCGACGYDTCEDHAVAIIEGLAEIEMCLPYTIERLHKMVSELAVSNEKLASMQQALKQSEKLAHMGQLSAGIAHELNNPLGVITMYSNLLLDEAPVESPVINDLKLIVEQADRCKKIVGGLLNFARKNQVTYTEVDIEDIIKKSISAIIVPPDIEISFYRKTLHPYAAIDTDQMVQVFSNIIKNACDALENKGKIDIVMDGNDDEIIVTVKDNGPGIKEEHMKKLFEPFFTTKPTGVGTGLGLPIVYGIIKMHKGKVDVITNVDSTKVPTGTSFIITFPRHKT